MMVVMDRRRRRRREVALAAAELAALRLEAQGVLLFAAATATGTRLVARSRHNHGRGRRRRWRRTVVMPVMRVVHRRRRRGAVVVESAARCREAGSREGQAGEDRSEGFDGLVVHITPSLSFWIVVRISRLHSARYVNEGFLTNFFWR